MSDPMIPNPIPLTRVHGETGLFIVSLILGIIIWGALVYLVVTSLTTGAIVILYLLILAVFYFILRVGLITHVRGNGARLGPEQFPEVYERVRSLAGRMGMKRVPEAYLLQEGGALNAFAARFIGRSMVVLYSDLLEACGDNAGARDMIIAHELMHVKAGHLRFRWLLLPSYVVPFLSLALSRAREYTCDLAGFAASGDKDSALLGLSILAVGGKYASRLRHQTMAAQRRDLNTGWMTLGQWFSTHPPLATRMAALDPHLSPETASSAGGTLRALAIMLGFVIVIAGGAALVAAASSAGVQNLLSLVGLDRGGLVQAQPMDAGSELMGAFAAIGTVLDEELASGGALPEDYDALVALWVERRGDADFPLDPFSGEALEYYPDGGAYELWSRGPDGEWETDDDVPYYGPSE